MIAILVYREKKMNILIQQMALTLSVLPRVPRYATSLDRTSTRDGAAGGKTTGNYVGFDLCICPLGTVVTYICK